MSGGLTSSSTVTVNSATPANYTSSQTPICKSLRVNAGAAGISDIYTPTGGKTLYITSILFSCSAAVYAKIGDNVTNALADATSYDGLMCVFDADATMGYNITLPTPMKVSTKLNIYLSAAGVACVGFQGWEQ